MGEREELDGQMGRWREKERGKRSREKETERWIVAAMETGKDRDERERSIRVMDG